MDVREQAVRRRQGARRAVAAAPRDPDHLRHGQRGDDRRGARHPGPSREDRDLAPLPAADAGDRRSRPRAHPAGRGRGASTGLDVVCHAAESFLAKPYSARASARHHPTTARRTRAPTRSPTSGRRKALEYGGRFLRRAVSDPDDVEARGAMMLAASMAGVGLRLGGRAHPARVRRIRSRASSTTTSRRATRTTARSIPHGISVIVTARRRSRSRSRPTRSATERGRRVARRHRPARDRSRR